MLKIRVLGSTVRYALSSAHGGGAAGLPLALGGLSLLELPAIPASCHLNKQANHVSQNYDMGQATIKATASL